MLGFIRRIIQRMNQYASRIWSICFSAFVFLIGFTIQALIFLDGKWYQGLVLIILGILSLICLVIAIVALTYYTKTTFREHRSRKLLRNLRGYLADMSHLGRDFMTENNNRQLEQFLERFKALAAEIEGYLEHTIPAELAVWKKPFSDRALAIAIKESVRKLEDIISKYEF